jgi:hypothetical protein
LLLVRIDAALSVDHFADLIGQLRGVEPDSRVQAQQASLSFADLHPQCAAGRVPRFRRMLVKRSHAIHPAAAIRSIAHGRGTQVNGKPEPRLVAIKSK